MKMRISLALSVLMLAIPFVPRTKGDRVGIDWNVIVDFVLDEAREHILEAGLDEVPLEDAKEEFRRRWGFILVDAEFQARQGHLRRLSSLERRGDATVTHQGPKYTLTSEVGLREAKILYKSYTVSLWGENILSGQIDGEIANNRLRVVMEFTADHNGCVSTLKEIKVTDIGGFQVSVTGLGPVDELASQISTWVSKKREDQIIKEMEYYLGRELTRSLDQFDCGQYISLLHL